MTREELARIIYEELKRQVDLTGGYIGNLDKETGEVCLADDYNFLELADAVLTALNGT